MSLLSKIGASERVFSYIYYSLKVSAPVAQLDRVPGFGPGGWGFESSRAYNLYKLSSIFIVTKIFILCNLFIAKSILTINQEVNSAAEVQ